MGFFPLYKNDTYDRIGDVMVSILASGSRVIWVRRLCNCYLIVFFLPLSPDHVSKLMVINTCGLRDQLDA